MFYPHKETNVKHTHESSQSDGNWMQNIFNTYPELRDPLEEMTGVDFVRYHILIGVYDGDIEAWEGFLTEEGTREQIAEDLPFVCWLKRQLGKDPDLLEQIRHMAEHSDVIDGEIVWIEDEESADD